MQKLNENRAVKNLLEYIDDYYCNATVEKITASENRLQIIFTEQGERASLTLERVTENDR